MHTSSESSSTGRALPGQREHKRRSVSVTHTSQGTEIFASRGLLFFDFFLFLFLTTYTSARELGMLSSTHFRSSSLRNWKSRGWKKGNTAICWTAKGTLEAALSDFLNSTVCHKHFNMAKQYNNNELGYSLGLFQRPSLSHLSHF